MLSPLLSSFFLSSTQHTEHLHSYDFFLDSEALGCTEFCFLLSTAFVTCCGLALPISLASFAWVEGCPSHPKHLALVVTVCSKGVDGSKSGANVPWSASSGKEGLGKESSTESSGKESGPSGKESLGEASGKKGFGVVSSKEGLGIVSGKEGSGVASGKEGSGIASGKEGSGEGSGKESRSKESGREGCGEETTREGWQRWSSGVVPASEVVAGRHWMHAADLTDHLSVVDGGVLGIDVGTEIPFEDPPIHISVVDLQTN
ncbi:uncharacterized protein EDB91DRAFT_1084489 [Suillus paluster]|uniref:uncharacterized protein n=1 Tax=Suillus paluster TaxID=48578 RepID=UPI001B86CAD6|nr:uncharacterized protein EDB91DRAFT_1084489 [Suillus paluster]KAG1733211.1 hypothetical protein EDB91DRAFT_1084489 [Suillus paluster]